MLIYVSCPYSAETEEERGMNVHRAIEAGIEIMKKGHTPIIPTLMHYFDLVAKEKGVEFAWQDYMDWCLEVLKPCDALLYMDSSKGCDIELVKADEDGKKIFYSVEEIDEENNSCIR